MSESMKDFESMLEESYSMRFWHGRKQKNLRSHRRI